MKNFLEFFLLEIHQEFFESHFCNKIRLININYPIKNIFFLNVQKIIHIYEKSFDFNFYIYINNKIYDINYYEIYITYNVDKIAN